jgi:hypothetical protein
LAQHGIEADAEHRQQDMDRQRREHAAADRGRVVQAP